MYWLELYAHNLSIIHCDLNIFIRYALSILRVYIHISAMKFQKWVFNLIVVGISVVFF